MPHILHAKPRRVEHADTAPTFTEWRVPMVGDDFNRVKNMYNLTRQYADEFLSEGRAGYNKTLAELLHAYREEVYNRARGTRSDCGLTSDAELKGDVLGYAMHALKTFTNPETAKIADYRLVERAVRSLAEIGQGKSSIVLKKLDKVSDAKFRGHLLGLLEDPFAQSYYNTYERDLPTRIHTSLP